MKKYPEWTLIDWDGNPALHLKCWRKSFSNGHVSIGVGDFYNIVYSYGPNSERSLSSTRWRPNGNHQTEQEAMAMVDQNNGQWVSRRSSLESLGAEIVGWVLK